MTQMMVLCPFNQAGAECKGKEYVCKLLHRNTVGDEECAFERMAAAISLIAKVIWDDHQPIPHKD